jgi:hypothetical protein
MISKRENPESGQRDAKVRPLLSLLIRRAVDDICMSMDIWIFGYWQDCQRTYSI